jgi:hypothetical protein
MTPRYDLAPKSRDGSAGVPPFRAHRAITTRCRRTMTRPSLSGAPERDALDAGSTRTRRARRWQYPNATRSTLAVPKRDALGAGSTQTRRARRWQYPNATRSTLAVPKRDALDAGSTQTRRARRNPTLHARRRQYPNATRAALAASAPVGSGNVRRCSQAFPRTRRTRSCPCSPCL